MPEQTTRRRVQRLDPLVAERIAAGEVVERPASVIKELVENSLDAGARTIQVELTNGGTTLMRVCDDGCGMTAEDARLALERFATSKITQWEDLDALSTLGFRGEALPSVAAVSRLEIHTCEQGSGHGTLLRVEGGVIVSESAAPPLQGTRVTVEDLFFNTPARLKFLKSSAAETGQVVDLLGRLALTCPGVHFQVRSNGREVFLVTSKMTLAQRMAQLWKVPLDELVEVRGEVQGVSVEGWVALPQHARPTRNHQLFSLNGRIIRSASLSQAVLEGFGPMLGRGRYPVALLALRIEPSQIDVNVHPTKAEVRFADAKGPFRAIYRSIAAALEKCDADSVQPQHWELVLDPPQHSPELPAAWHEPPPPAYEPQGVPAYEPPPRPRAFPRGPGGPPPPPLSSTLQLFQPLDLRPASGARVQVLAQLYRTFIVAQVDGELWVVDQHTAHERIWYERLAHLQPLDGAQQGLLVPEVIEFAPGQAALLEGSLDQLRSFGFELEPFGGNSFQLRSLPTGIKPGKAAGLIRELVETLASEQITMRNHPQEQVREKLRAMVSCKAAIKAGDALSTPEMQALIEEMLDVEHSNYCPHGRPTRVKLDDRALERLFHR